MDLETWRKKNGLSQVDASKKLGFTQPTISRFEADESIISLKAAVVIFRKAGIQVGPLRGLKPSEAGTVSKTVAGAA